ncbi:hypothetical protein SLS57_006045 [Botryosphaeria dothidea]
MPHGKLVIEGNAIPSFSPPYQNTPIKFSDVSMVGISYRVTLSSIQHLVPNVLELEEEPLVMSTFIEYGMSSVGSYTEFVQSVEVSYRGESFFYPLFLILDNDAAVFAGRELYGYPKVFGRTVMQQTTGTRLVTGHVERPKGREIGSFEFVPEQRSTKLPLDGRRVLNLRVIPSPVPGSPASVKEFVPTTVDFESKEVWLGKGHVSFPKTSTIDPWANVEILRYEGSFFARGISAVLNNATEVFRL